MPRGLVLVLLFFVSRSTVAQTISSFHDEPPLPTPSQNAIRLLQDADGLNANGEPRKALQIRKDFLSGLQSSPFKDPIGEAWTYFGIGRDLAMLKQWPDAIAAERQAIQGFDKFSVGKFDALVMLAGMLRDRKDPAADATFSQAADLARSETTWPGVMEDRVFGVGTSLVAYQEPQWGEEFLKIAVALCDKYAQAPAIEKANAELHLGKRELQTGRFDSAIQRLTVAIDIYQKHIDGLLSGEQKERAEAEAAKRAGDIVNQQQHELIARTRHDTFVSFVTGLINALNGLAMINIKLGNDRSAKEYLAKAKATADNHQLVSAVTVNTLLLTADLEIERAEFNTAGDTVRNALFNAAQGRDFLELVRCLEHQTALSLKQRNYVAAGDYVSLAIQILGAGFEPELDAKVRELNALTEARTYRRKEAKEDLEYAISFYERMGWKLDLARALRERVGENLNGDAARDQADLVKSRDIVNGLAPHSLEVGELEALSGEIAYAAHDYAEAEEHDRRALQLAETKIPGSFAVAAMKMNLGSLLLLRGNAAKAQPTKQQLESQAYELMQSGWEKARSLQSQFYGEEASESYARMLATYAYDLAQLQIVRNDYAGALATLERSRGLGIEQLTLQHGKVSGNTWKLHQVILGQRHRTEAEYLRAMRRRVAADQELGALRAQAAGGETLEKARTRLRRAYEEEDRTASIYVFTLAGTEEFWSQVQKEVAQAVPPYNAQAILDGLPRGSTFVMFATDSRHERLLEVALRGGTRDVLARIVDDSGAGGQPLYRRLAQFTNLVAHEPQKADYATEVSQITELGKGIFADLFPGEWAKAIAQSQHLIFSPDAALWRFPFAALPTGINPDGTAQYLGLEKGIVYSPSLRLFLDSLKPNSRVPITGDRVLVLGDPKFDTGSAATKPETNDGNNPPSGQLWAGRFSRNRPPTRLSATRHEAERVACLLRGKPPLLDEQASERRLREGIRDASLIHLATHGFIDPALPMSSGMILSPPEADPAAGQTDNDGVLQALEIFAELQLKAEMVVLSACETALGRDVTGEGVIGLSRAFQYAGARSVVASLWTVEDKSTSALMENFYADLLRGRTKDEALQSAMTHVASERSVPYWVHPHFWAAFTIIGNPGELRFANTTIPNCR